MVLGPTLSLLVLALLALFIVVTAVRSMIRIVKTVVIVGILVALLFGAGVMQLPGGVTEVVPEFGDMAYTVSSSVTGLVTEAGMTAVEEQGPDFLANVTEQIEQSQSGQ